MASAAGNSAQAIINLNPESFTRSSPGIPALLLADPRTTMKKSKDGSYTGQIRLVNIVREQIAFKTDSTDPEMLEFLPSAGVISPLETLIVTVKTIAGLNINFGDIKYQFLMVHSTPVSVTPANHDVTLKDLEDFWTENVILENSEHLLIKPMHKINNMNRETSVHDNEIEQYKNNLFVRLSRFFSAWWTPYALDEQPKALEEFELEDQDDQINIMYLFNIRKDDIRQQKDRLNQFQHAKSRGIFYSFGLVLLLTIISCIMYLGYIEKQKWDAIVARRKSSWFQSFLGVFGVKW